MPASSFKKQAAASAASKPYDRPGKSAAKGKGKAGAAPSTSSAGVNIGAPATHGQSSRKGKKAWRKNVDITQEESALEQGREEERITGGKVAERRNDDLFMVDTVGDVAVAQKLRRAPKPLRSLAVLNERSAVPSLTSKSIIPPTSSASKSKSRISSAEKERLRRIARRTAVDTDGITTSAEIKVVGPALTDAWNASTGRAVPVGEFGEEGIVKPTVKTPITIARQREIYLSNQVMGGRGLETPDQGTSYNPKEADHTRLIELAVEEEKAQLAREAAEEERIRVLGEVKNARRQHVDGDEFEYAPGMTVGPGEVGDGASDEEGDDDDADAAGPSKKVQKRKTQAQRNKAKRLKEQARLDAIEKTHKRLVASIGGVKGVQASLEKREKQIAEADRLAKLAKKQRERMGLEGGEKVGKHRVVKPRVTVQLGEDLAESLRQVKPEGNLFRDRYLALQRKALVEPRVKQMHKKHKLRTKEYEKHAYKRFQ